MFKFVVSLLLLSCVEARIDWGFESFVSWLRLSPISVGRPYQIIKPLLHINDYPCFGFSTPDADLDSEYGFNISQSSTFTQISTDKYSILGADNFMIVAPNGTKQYLHQKRFNVRDVKDDDNCWIFGQLSFAHAPNGDNPFLDSVLAEEPERIAVITFNSTPADPFTSFAGVLTLGERPELCSSNWAMFDTVDAGNFSQWALKIDRFKLGKFVKSDVGITRLNLNEPFLKVSHSIYPTVLRLLGITDEIDRNWVACNSTDSMIFTIGGVDIVIDPKDYADQDFHRDLNDCYFLGGEDDTFADRQFMLPNTVFRNRCLLFDFENKKIGLADRLDRQH